MLAKIAVIEDDYSIREMYRFKLEMAGYSVQTAEDGLLGLALITSFVPDLVLLDIKMPNLSGDEMLQQLRSTELGSNIKVIVLTNISRSEAPKHLQFLQVERYIVKAHSTPKQVVEVVEEVLNSQRD